MNLNLAIIVFIYWGLVPIFYKLINWVSSVDIMLHRIVWSSVLLGIYLLIDGSLFRALEQLRDLKRTGILFITGALISADWGLYIYMVEQNQILETSLGYFIAPIIGIFFGRIFFAEKMGKLGKMSFALALIACAYEAFTLGRLPLLSIALALMVNLYTLVRKKITISAKYGFFLETLLITPFALAAMFFRPSVLTFSSPDLLLVASGLVTVLPMLLYNYITPKLDLSLLSILQYICPVISFCVAIFLYDEPLDFHKLISFSLIICAVALSIFERKKWA